MKKLLLILLALTFVTVPIISDADDSEKTYKDLFRKDEVIDVLIDIDEDDLADIRNYPRNEEYHSADITVDGVKTENAGIRTKGNMTLNSVASSDSDRYSYRIKFNKYVKGNKLLGLDELCLNSGYSDPSYMREYLHYEILRQMGMNVPETAFCRVYINGKYAGLYLAVEGLDGTFLKDNFGENYKNGNFYKMDEGSTLEYKEDENYSYADLKSGDDTDLSDFKEFVKKLNNVTTGEKGDIESFLDADSVLKYIASNTVLCNYDSYNGNMHHNFYLYENENGIFTVVPWDFNMSFGGFNGDNAEVGIDTPFISGSLETLPLINKLLSVPEYKEKYYGYIKDIMNILENFDERISELKEILSPYVKADTTSFYSYEEFDKATSKQTEVQPTADSGKTTDNTQSEGSADKNGKRGKSFGGNSSIINCIEKRLENIKKQFAGEADKTTENAQNFRGNRNGDFKGDRQPPQNDRQWQPGENDGEEKNLTPPEPPENSNAGNNGEFRPQPPEQMQNGEPPQGQPDTNTTGQIPDSDQTQIQKGNGFGGGCPDFKGNKLNSSEQNNNTIRVHVNGHIIKFDKDPYIKNDITLVGFRSILEALGANVEWDAATKTVTAVKGGTTVRLTIGDKTAYVNGKPAELTQAPEISDNSTMIPIRFISEQLGMTVSWDAGTRLITVTSK